MVLTEKPRLSSYVCLLAVGLTLVFIYWMAFRASILQIGADLAAVVRRAAPDPQARLMMPGDDRPPSFRIPTATIQGTATLHRITARGVLPDSVTESPLYWFTGGPTDSPARERRRHHFQVTAPTAEAAIQQVTAVIEGTGVAESAYTVTTVV